MNWIAHRRLPLSNQETSSKPPLDAKISTLYNPPSSLFLFHSIQLKFPLILSYFEQEKNHLFPYILPLQVFFFISLKDLNGS